MQMTESEIVRNYRESKNKKNQIQVLADLNECKPAEIKEILKQNGEDLRAANGGRQKSTGFTTVPEMLKKIDIPENHLPDPQKGKCIKDTSGSCSGCNEKDLCFEYDKKPTVKIPQLVRKTLEEDLKNIEEQLSELIEKKIAIKSFLEDN